MKRGSSAWKAAGITRQYKAWRQEWKTQEAAARRREALRRTVEGLTPLTDIFRRAGAALKAVNPVTDKRKSAERSK